MVQGIKEYKEIISFNSIFCAGDSVDPCIFSIIESKGLSVSSCMQGYTKTKKHRWSGEVVGKTKGGNFCSPIRASLSLKQGL